MHGAERNGSVPVKFGGAEKNAAQQKEVGERLELESDSNLGP